MSYYTCCPCNDETFTKHEPYNHNMHNVDTDDVTETNTIRSVSLISTGTFDEHCDSSQADDDTIQDMVFVDGNESDLQICKDEDELLERVWQLSKPPIIPKKTSVVSARRVQVMRERLSSTVKKIPPLSETLREQVERSIKAEYKANKVKYESVYEQDEDIETLCPQISFPIRTPTFAELI